VRGRESDGNKGAKFREIRKNARGRKSVAKTRWRFTQTPLGRERKHLEWSTISVSTKKKSAGRGEGKGEGEKLPSLKTGQALR